MKDREGNEYTASPLRIEAPQFKCSTPFEYAMEADIEISDPSSGNKTSRRSTLTFRTDNVGGYDMCIALRIDNKNLWFRQDQVNEISISFHGDYEADTLKQFFQHVGRMMLATYGDQIAEIESYFQP